MIIVEKYNYDGRGLKKYWTAFDSNGKI